MSMAAQTIRPDVSAATTGASDDRTLTSKPSLGAVVDRDGGEDPPAGTAVEPADDTCHRDTVGRGSA